MSVGSRSTSSASATQLTLVFINFLFVAVGTAAMVLGSWVFLYREEIRSLTVLDVATNNLGLLQNAAILLITCGLFLFVLGFLGCCATYKSQRCTRIVYICLVILCCVLTCISCGIAFAFRDQVEEKLLADLERRLKSEYQGYTTSEKDFSMALDWAQVEFECCGIRSYKDFGQAVNWTMRNSTTVPFTCCIMTDKDAFLDDWLYTLKYNTCARSPNSTNSNIERPCYKELKDWMEQEVLIVAGIAIGGIVLQILAALFMVGVMRRPAKNMNQLYRDASDS